MRCVVDPFGIRLGLVWEDSWDLFGMLTCQCSACDSDDSACAFSLDLFGIRFVWNSIRLGFDLFGMQVVWEPNSWDLTGIRFTRDSIRSGFALIAI